MYNLAIIILNYRQYDYTMRTVDHLLEINVSEDIYVVDNCSPNDSYARLKEKYENVGNVSVIQSEKNGGYSYGNNYGIRFAQAQKQYDYICIMNPDVIVPDNYFQEMCAKLEAHPEYAVIVPLMLYPDHIDMADIGFKLAEAKMLYREHFLLYRFFKKKKADIRFEHIGDGLLPTECVPIAIFIVDAKAFASVGYFDEGCFLHNEEPILGHKMQSIGKGMLIDVSHYYLHYHLSTVSTEDKWQVYKKNFGSILDNYNREYESRKYLCEKYYGGKYINRLRMVRLINLFMLHTQRILALVLKR